MNRPARSVAFAFAVVVALLMGGAGSALAQPTDLIISEYIEGSSNNKAIEIFNPSSSTIDLSAGSYVLLMYFNGNATSTFNVPLTGTMAPGTHRVIAPTNANATILAVADVTLGTGWFNGDDALVLRKTVAGSPVVVDSFGVVGTDPGNYWGTAATATMDHTLRRKASVCVGDTVVNDAFDPATQWEVFPVDTFDGLASHTTTCSGGTDGAPTVTATVPASGATGVSPYSALIVTFSELVTAGDTSFALACPAGVPVPFTTAMSGKKVTITPDAPLPAGATCTATVLAAQVSDVDLTDPPDSPASDVSWTFSVSTNPAITINDVSVTEGNAGTVLATFTVSLSYAAGAGGVTFDIATVNGTATTAGNDYVAKSLTGQTIAAGSTSYTFTVVVNGDTTTEPDETFSVNLSNVVGADVADGQGTCTIISDDVALTAINAIQGTGATSPLVGTMVTTRGIVTGVKYNNGFFIQEPDDAVAGAPGAASEGIFVYTSAPPPAIAAVGNLVQVSGIVTEYKPGRAPLTELSSPTVTLVSTGNPLPTAVQLTSSLPAPGGAWDQLERLEGMRVRVDSFTVTAPTTGTTNEPNATGSSYGECFGVVTGVPRPFREEGIQQPDAAPAGNTIPPLPRWDSNPELLRFDSDGLVGATRLDLPSGAVLTGLVGPLDFAYDRYSILQDPSAGPGVTSGPGPRAVSTPLPSEFTVASYNLERFFDDSNDPAIGEPVLTATAFANRLAKASLGIRNYLKTPDVVGIVEMEDLPTLQKLATKISTDAVAAGQPDPLYASYLVEGNDVGGIDVGFLVKTALVAPSTPRVSVVSVTQERDGTLFTNPDGTTETLNDRPPLMLRAVIHNAAGASFPVTVIVNHLRSMGDVDSSAAGSNGWATNGARVRAKRLAQALDLADLVQDLQVATPTERIILVGDFNAFDVNDGYGHSMATIAGTTFADDTTAVPGDGTNTVEPDLVNLISTVAATERYSFVFEGTIQSLDHVLVNGAIVTSTVARRLEHARINADFPEINRGATVGPAAATRLSDHDPLVSYFQVADFLPTGVSVSMTDTTDPVFAGAGLAYTINVANGSASAATGLSLTDAIPSGTVFASLAAPAGWSCSTPAIGATGTVTCTNPTLAAGASAYFTLTVTVGAGLPGGTLLTNTVSVTQTSADANPADNSATATTTVQTNPLISATKTVVGLAAPGGPLTWTVTLTNGGSNSQLDNPGNEFSDVLPSSVTLVSASATSGTAVATVATNTVTWNGSIPGGGSVTITIVGTVSSSAVTGQVISNQATVYYDRDGNGTNESSSVSDDPATAAVGDATSISVTRDANGSAVVPTLDGLGLGLLAALVALGGVLLLGRRLS